MKSRLALTLLAAAALALGLLSQRSNRAEKIELPSEPVEEQMRAAIHPPAVAEATDGASVNDEPRLAPKLELAQGQLAWEAKIESITTDHTLNDTAKARRLLALIAALPEHGMTTASEEAVQRLPDADYNAVALPMVANPQTHGLVESVLFADLMERPDAIALPALLRIARIPNHPYAKFAHDNLDLLVGEDFGADWLKWEAAVQKTLAAEK